ncbi:MAG TPA: L,D-transpeptidase family protein [Candidatus Microsaccharimonas sp.]|nr:L,D-transpeptidase family protein [Candidatus Microsaccharimonas sp.]
MEQTDTGEVREKQPAKRAWLAPNTVHLDTPHHEQHDSIALVLPSLPVSNESDKPSGTPAHHPSQRIRFAIGIAGTLCVLLGIAGVYSINHSILPVQVASLAPTHQPASPTFQTTLESATRAYRLTIVDVTGVKKTYPLQDTGLTVDVATTLKAARTTHSLRFWRPIRVPLTLRTDSQKLQAFIQAHTIVASTQPQNAKLEITAGKTTITPEKAGYGYRLAGGSTAIVQQVRQLNRSPLVLSKGSITPTITAASLQVLQKQVNATLAQPLQLTINDKTTTIAPSDIGTWLTIQPDTTGKLATRVNQQAVKAYLEQQAAPFTGSTPDTVTQTADGSSLQVVQQSGSASVTNEQSLVNQLSAHLLDDKGQALSLQISGTPGKTVTILTPAKWLLVNLSTKRMYAYEGSTLIRSFLISAGAASTPTVVGTYKIYAKYASQDMSGENADGTNYFQPNVQYVNYFYKDYAVHGNYWRPLSYFGNVNSSHGCVGIVNSDAQWLYSWAPIGTTVMTHY